MKVWKETEIQHEWDISSSFSVQTAAAGLRGQGTMTASFPAIAAAGTDKIIPEEPRLADSDLKEIC